MGDRISQYISKSRMKRKTKAARPPKEARIEEKSRRKEKVLFTLLF